MYRKAGKRLLDIVLSTGGLLLLAPLLVLVSIVAGLAHGLPVFYNQQRVGRYGNLFTIFKFRTMQPHRADTEAPNFTPGDAHRVTKIGLLLRRFKIDELPQLFNVFKGDMSLVGPRPEVEHWTKYYPEAWSYVHSVRPGITDRASICFRHEEVFLCRHAAPEIYYKEQLLPLKLKMSKEYVSNISLMTDIKILIDTVRSLNASPDEISGITSTGEIIEYEREPKESEN